MVKKQFFPVFTGLAARCDISSGQPITIQLDNTQWVAIDLVGDEQAKQLEVYKIRNYHAGSVFTDYWEVLFVLVSLEHWHHDIKYMFHQLLLVVQNSFSIKRRIKELNLLFALVFHTLNRVVVHLTIWTAPLIFVTKPWLLVELIILKILIVLVCFVF